MLTTLFICFSIGSVLHAASIPTPISTPASPSVPSSEPLSTTTSPPPFVIDDELNKIAASCIYFVDQEEITGYLYKWRIAIRSNFQLIEESIAKIGIEELHSAIGFAPPGPWKSCREPEETDSIEEYVESKFCNLGISRESDYFPEDRYPPAIAFLDKRFPTIRRIFRHKFEEKQRFYEEKSIDRKSADHMVEEFRNIYNRVLEAYSAANRKMVRCEFAREHLTD
ncbi:hypothetical protein CAEBREN_10279 [Caenorhabditis brenneri]|uniref:Uncharacterized protein n=1 Tax=Caenorhabditis brenneri TaxID=135651 RepID=G0P092_CAEBE|nr:hypothetical protein CAEBREN_10279 [Caenorhabditis brenneri]